MGWPREVGGAGAGAPLAGVLDGTALASELFPFAGGAVGGLSGLFSPSTQAILNARNGVRATQAAQSAGSAIFDVASQEAIILATRAVIESSKALGRLVHLLTANAAAIGFGVGVAVSAIAIAVQVGIHVANAGPAPWPSLRLQSRSPASQSTRQRTSLRREARRQSLTSSSTR